jgi:hypothetical protein
MTFVDTIYSLYQGFYFWWVFILLGLLVGKLLWKAWKVDVVIIEKRGNNLIKSNDRATRYTDPYTGVTGYKLQKSKDTIPIVNYDWVLHNSSIPTTFIDKIINLLRGNVGTIFLFRYGSKQYKPIKITEGKNVKMKYQQVKDKKGNIIYVNVYKQFDPRNILGELDFEVVDWDNMNFMVQEQRASIERRKKKGDFWKGIVVPLMILAITALVCIVMIKFSFDYAASIRNDVPANSQASAPNVPIIGDILPGGSSPNPGI